MRQSTQLFFLFLIILTAVLGFNYIRSENTPYTLRIILYPDGDSDGPEHQENRDHRFVNTLRELVNATGRLQLEVIEEPTGSLDQLSALKLGRADLALAENSMPFTRGISTVMPLYSGVLHILVKKDAPPEKLGQFLDGKRVWAKSKGSFEREFLSAIARSENVNPEYVLLDSVSPDEPAPDVVVFVGPVSPEVTRWIDPSYRFYSLDSIDNLDRGSIAEGISLMVPRMQPYVIPAQTYPGLNEGPILTLAVDRLLVARDSLPDEVVYELTELIYKNKPMLSSHNEALFRGIREDFPRHLLSFPLHPGAWHYFERDLPSFIERYAEVMGVFISLAVALISGSFALYRWNQQRKKDTIDKYYSKILKVRMDINDTMTETERQEAISFIRSLEQEAFELLIDEKVAADDSFRIFITLSNDTLRELGAREGVSGMSLIGKL